MQIKEKMYVGDFVAIPFNENYLLGVVTNITEQSFNLNVLKRVVLNSDDNFGIGLTEDGKLDFGVLNEN